MSSALHYAEAAVAAAHRGVAVSDNPAEALRGWFAAAREVITVALRSGRVGASEAAMALGVLGVLEALRVEARDEPVSSAMYRRHASWLEWTEDLYARSPSPALDLVHALDEVLNDGNGCAGEHGAEVLGTFATKLGLRVDDVAGPFHRLTEDLGTSHDVVPAWHAAIREAAGEADYAKAARSGMQFAEAAE